MISLMLIPQFGVELPFLMVELLLLIASNCISGTKLQQLFHICKFFYVFAEKGGFEKRKALIVRAKRDKNPPTGDREGSLPSQKEIETPRWMSLFFFCGERGIRKTQSVNRSRVAR